MVHPIVAQLHAKRREHGMTMTELANRIGYAHQSIGEVERGMTNPSLNLLQCWAEALGLKLTVERAE